MKSKNLKFVQKKELLSFILSKMGPQNGYPLPVCFQEMAT